MINNNEYNYEVDDLVYSKSFKINVVQRKRMIEKLHKKYKVCKSTRILSNGYSNIILEKIFEKFNLESIKKLVRVKVLDGYKKNEISTKDSEIEEFNALGSEFLYHIPDFYLNHICINAESVKDILISLDIDFDGFIYRCLEYYNECTNLPVCYFDDTNIWFSLRQNLYWFCNWFCICIIKYNFEHKSTDFFYITPVHYKINKWSKKFLGFELDAPVWNKCFLFKTLGILNYKNLDSVVCEVHHTERKLFCEELYVIFDYKTLSIIKIIAIDLDGVARFIDNNSGKVEENNIDKENNIVLCSNSEIFFGDLGNKIRYKSGYNKVFNFLKIENKWYILYNGRNKLKTVFILHDFLFFRQIENVSECEYKVYSISESGLIQFKYIIKHKDKELKIKYSNNKNLVCLINCDRLVIYDLKLGSKLFEIYQSCYCSCWEKDFFEKRIDNLHTLVPSYDIKIRMLQLHGQYLFLYTKNDRVFVYDLIKRKRIKEYSNVYTKGINACSNNINNIIIKKSKTFCVLSLK